MSERWYIQCLDCEATHAFENTNHNAALMQELIGIAPLLYRLCLPEFFEIESRVYSSISLPWFHEHGNHRLAAISEYGQLMEMEVATCSRCGSTARIADVDIVSVRWSPDDKWRKLGKMKLCTECRDLLDKFFGKSD